MRFGGLFFFLYLAVLCLLFLALLLFTLGLRPASFSALLFQPVTVNPLQIVGQPFAKSRRGFA